MLESSIRKINSEKKINGFYGFFYSLKVSFVIRLKFDAF